MNSRDVLNAIESAEVLNVIESARDNGDFDSVKRLSKIALENSQSDRDTLLIMNQIAHMYLDSFLIWSNEMKKIDKNVDTHTTLHGIAQQLENGGWAGYTRYMREMIKADAEEVRNNFLSVDDDKENLEGRGIL